MRDTLSNMAEHKLAWIKTKNIKFETRIHLSRLQFCILLNVGINLKGAGLVSNLNALKINQSHTGYNRLPQVSVHDTLSKTMKHLKLNCNPFKFLIL